MKSWYQTIEHGKRFIVQPQLPTARRHAICLNHVRVRAAVKIILSKTLTSPELGDHGLQHGRVVCHAAGVQLTHERARRRQLLEQRAQLLRRA